MSGAWSNDSTTSLALPTGSIPPEPGIYLNGATDTILIYSSTDALIASIAATAGTDGFGNSYPAGISATSGVISNSVILLYNGTPANGNLITSLAAMAGTDGFGNAYAAGFGTYNGAVNTDHIDNVTGNARFGNASSSHFSFDVVNSVLDVANSSAQNVIQLDATRESVFVYSGAPALGNLIASISSGFGTDSFGNNFLQGITSYDGGNSGEFASLSNGTVYVSQGHTDFTLAGGVAIGGGSDVLVQSGNSATLTEIAYVDLVPGTTGTVPGAAGNAAVKIGTVSTNVTDGWISGALVYAPPGSTAYTHWQTPSYSTGWAAGSSASASYQPLLYRIDAENNLWLFGSAHATAATPTNTVFILPAAYRPVALGGVGSYTIFPAGSMVQTTSADAAKASGRLNVMSNGDVVIGGFTVALNDNFYFNHKIPLGNLS